MKLLKIFFHCIFFYFLLCPIISSSVYAVDNNWKISGTNNIRSDYYNSYGDKGSSPYKSENFQTFNDINLNLNRQKSPYELWRGQMSGAANQSNYRSSNKGFIVDRINLFREKGNASLPYRIEIGDIYGFFSLRTLQRSLKGLQLEFQPHLKSKSKHSIVLVSGANQSSWKEFKVDENYTNGISYLFDDQTLGRYVLNYVHNKRKGNTQSGTLDRKQQVYGIAGQKNILISNQTITLDGEISQFSGDHDGTSNPASGQNKKDNGLYLQLSGKSNKPLTYRLRYEKYGQDFRPEGAGITPDKKSIETNASYRFASGLQITSRLQNLRDNCETQNPTDTNVYGISLSGSLFPKMMNNLTGNLDVSSQDVENRNKSTNHTVQTATINLNKPINLWNTRLGIFYQNRNDKTTTSSDSTTKQLNVSADHNITLFGFNGSISPAMTIRKIGGSSKSVDTSPTISLNITKGVHNLGYNISFNSQNRNTPLNADVSTFSNNISYRYTKKQDAFSVELNSENRNPGAGQNTSSYKIGISWSHPFEISLKRKTYKAETEIKESKNTTTMVHINLLDLAPLSDMKTIEEKLKNANIKGAVKHQNTFVYETKLIDEIDNRQRLALVYDKDKKLKKSALIIDFPDISNLDTLMQNFEQIKKTLMEKYGKPDNFYETGEVNQDIINNIKNGNFIRVTEWTKQGGILRFGIPRRLDGIVRMELQFAEDFPSIQETLWSVEEVK